MESKMKTLREELDELGYFQSFTPESVSLVERLTADLKTTTHSLQKYIRVAQNAIEERDILNAGAEPYKCDNAKLVGECNDLHFKFIEFKEHNDRIRSDLQYQLQLLKAENADCVLERDKLRGTVKQLKLDLIDRENLFNSKHKINPSMKRSTNNALPNQKTTKVKTFEINSAMALADQKICNLSKDVKKLKEHNLQLIEANELLQEKIDNRDKEIRRLNDLLEGGRPLHAIKKDCCCSKESHENMNTFQEQHNKILKEKLTLENRLKDSLAKQHEAMNRALYLAERNKHLEKEMKDIDHLALAVEAECNNTVRTNTEKVNRLQERLQQSLLEIKTLKTENNQLEKDKQEFSAELDVLRAEKKHLQSVLETSLEDKKRLTDRINNFTIIEHDLNMEIDRLTQLSAEQRRTIAEVEASGISKNQLTESSPTHSVITKSQTVNNANKNKFKKKSNIKKTSKGESVVTPQETIKVPANTPHDILGTVKCCNCCCDTCSSSKHLKDLLHKELELREQQVSRCMENLKSEKDYYMKEYHKILEQRKSSLNRQSSRTIQDKTANYLKQITERDEKIFQLQNENDILAKEKFSLLSRLDSTRHDFSSGMDGPCLRTLCKRNERERDLIRCNLERLEEENDELQTKLKTLSNSQVDGQEKLQKILMETEEQARRLEQERRELLQGQESEKALTETLEEQCAVLTDQLRNVQTELNQQKAQYSQLKSLHEQTNLSLADTQRKLVQAETEITTVTENLKKRNEDRGEVNKEIDMLKKDIQIMKVQMNQLDEEKDELLVNLDDKTEKAALLEIDLKAKDKKVLSLEAAINEMKKKYSARIEESTEQEQQLRNNEAVIANLNHELETVKKIKDSAVQENRKLRDDLCSATCDCRDSRKELELYKRQVDDLKTQLQQYVAEVKRAEDLISNKEIERNEILDQFRTLSQEANMLENNNHTLETEASNSRVQLSVALDHTADLEKKLENKDSIIRSYEKQIADLTSQIASLELQLRQFIAQYERSDGELQNMRDLCLKLENENSKYKRQIRDREDQRVMLDRNVDQLRSEREFLQHTTARDRRQIDHVEKDLDDAKQETSELRLLSQDLQEEVQRLKIQLQELKDKFINTSEQLDVYQEKALEYSQQNKQLRREIANERFRRTRDSDSSKTRNCVCIAPTSSSNSKRSEKGDSDLSSVECFRNKIRDQNRTPREDNPLVRAESSTTNKCEFQTCLVLRAQTDKSLTANYTILHNSKLNGSKSSQINR